MHAKAESSLALCILPKHLKYILRWISSSKIPVPRFRSLYSLSSTILSEGNILIAVSRIPRKEIFPLSLNLFMNSDTLFVERVCFELSVERNSPFSLIASSLPSNITLQIPQSHTTLWINSSGRQHALFWLSTSPTKSNCGRIAIVKLELTKPHFPLILIGHNPFLKFHQAS